MGDRGWSGLHAEPGTARFRIRGRGRNSRTAQHRGLDHLGRRANYRLGRESASRSPRLLESCRSPRFRYDRQPGRIDGGNSLNPFPLCRHPHGLAMVISLHAAPASAAPVTAPSTFAEVYRDNAQRVTRWASCLGGVDCDVEDVVQEVFLVVSRKLTSVRDKGAFASWLFQITRKIVANHRRRLRWRQLWTGHDKELDRIPWGGSDPAAELERRRMVTLLQLAIDRLPDKYRTVFVLYEIRSE